MDMYRGIETMLPSERTLAHKTNLLLADLLQQGSRPQPPGVTLRQHFAGLALQGILGHKMPYDHAPDAFERPAYEAVRAADALLAELAKDPQPLPTQAPPK